jgi:hypothetical protein
MSSGYNMNLSEMKVVKRNNIHEDVSFDKILNRVKKIGKEFNVNINYSQLVMKVIEQLYNGIPTKKIDELTAEQCAALCTQNPDYGTLAGIIVISNHQKSTSSSFKEVVEKLYNFKDINSNLADFFKEPFNFNEYNNENLITDFDSLDED